MVGREDRLGWPSGAPLSPGLVLPPPCPLEATACSRPQGVLPRPQLLQTSRGRVLSGFHSLG